MFTFVAKRGPEIRVPMSVAEQLGLFKRRPELLRSGAYKIKSDVGPGVIGVFFAQLYGDECMEEVSEKNAIPLLRLCDELGFSGFGDIHKMLGQSRSREGEDWKEHRCETMIEEQQRQIHALQRQLQMQGEMIQKLVARESTPDVVDKCEIRVNQAKEELSGMMKATVAAVVKDVQQLKTEVKNNASSVANDVQQLKTEVKNIGSSVANDVQQLKSDVRSNAAMATADIQRLRTETNSKASCSDLDGLRTRVSSLEVKAQANSLPAAKTCWYDPGNPLNGILVHLTRQYGGNVHDKGVVTITASSFVGCEEPRNAADIGTDSQFHSQNQPNSWICYDFKYRRVSLTSYSLRSCCADPGGWQTIVQRSRLACLSRTELMGGGHLKSWVVEISNDGSLWEPVDSRQGTSELNSRCAVRNFAISAANCRSVRFVRLRQTGPNHVETHELIISSFELFGTISPP